jgi:hypothetical protein
MPPAYGVSPQDNKRTKKQEGPAGISKGALIEHVWHVWAGVAAVVAGKLVGGDTEIVSNQDPPQQQEAKICRAGERVCFSSKKQARPWSIKQCVAYVACGLMEKSRRGYGK